MNRPTKTSAAQKCSEGIVKMKKQTLLSRLLLFSLLCGLCACGGTAVPAESGTAAQMETQPPKAEPVRVPVSSLGLTPYCVTSEAQTVAGAVRDGEDIVLTPLGHHSATGDCICDDLEYSYNTADNPLYCGVHLANVNGLKILGDRFISVGKATERSAGTDAAGASADFTAPPKNGTTYCARVSE